MKMKSNLYYIPVLVVALAVVGVFFKDISEFAGYTDSEFRSDLNKINEINNKYQVDLFSFPETVEVGNQLMSDLKALQFDQESSKLLLDLRTKLTESDIFLKEGWKYGKGSTTKYGFGCRKGLPRLRNATFNRNMSSTIGYEAVTIMHELIDNYPKEAELAGVTKKQALFFNASFFQEQQDALRDRRLVERACVKKEENN